jgi:hypothetical protein
MRNAYRDFVGRLEVRRPVGVEGRIILKRNLKGV